MRGVQRQRKVRRRRGQSAGGAGCEGCERRRGVRKALLIGKPWLNLVFGKKIGSSSEMYNLQTDYLLLYLSCLFHTVHISFTRPATRMQRTSNDVVREILGQKSAQYREPASLFWVSSPFLFIFGSGFCLSFCVFADWHDGRSKRRRYSSVQSFISNSFTTKPRPLSSKRY